MPEGYYRHARVNDLAVLGWKSLRHIVSVIELSNTL